MYRIAFSRVREAREEAAPDRDDDGPRRGAPEVFFLWWFR